MADGFTVEFTPARGNRRRVRYEPRSNGPGHWRIDEIWNGFHWRIRGREPVRDIVCECSEGNRK